LQNPSEPGPPPQRICSEFTLALAPEFAFLSASYQMFPGVFQIQLLSPADCQFVNVEFFYTKAKLIAQAAAVLFFGAGGKGKVQGTTLQTVARPRAGFAL